VWTNPLLLLPWRADKENLQPVYDAIAPKIREKDPDHLIMFEPVTWSGEPYLYEGDVGFEVREEFFFNRAFFFFPFSGLFFA
jgi:hypothetical protein